MKTSQKHGFIQDHPKMGLELGLPAIPVQQTIGFGVVLDSDRKKLCHVTPTK